MTNAAILRAQSAHAADRRTEDRVEVFLKTALFEGGTMGEALTLINLSCHGFLGRSPAKHMIGARLAIYLPGLGQVEAVTRWSGNGLLGCEFLYPIPEEVFRLLLDVIQRSGHH